jgi:hypothetical protein
MAREDHTAVIQGCIDRLRVGDESARAALLGCAADRLARLARRRLRSYPGVARWEQTDDVAQNALIRLDRALRAVVPPTAREFFRLAAAQVRSECPAGLLVMYNLLHLCPLFDFSVDRTSRVDRLTILSVHVMPGQPTKPARRIGAGMFAKRSKVRLKSTCPAVIKTC